MSNVFACIDGSPSTRPVCDYAVWAGRVLKAQLTFMHVLEERLSIPTGLSSSASEAQAELIRQLSEVNAERDRLMREQGYTLLSDAKQLAEGAGVAHVETLQRHGSLVGLLKERETDIDLLVIGRQGKDSAPTDHIGSQLDNLTRSLMCPILVAPSDFSEPTSALFAFDGSDAAVNAVKALASGELAKLLQVHLVMVDNETPARRRDIETAADMLRKAGTDVTTAIQSGNVTYTLQTYRDTHKLDVLIVGAYGHSRIRQFLLGSTTRHLLRTWDGPLLLLR